MKKVLALALVLSVPLSAHAAQRRFQGRRQEGWRSLAYGLPGAYGMLDRLTLSNDQKKQLDEVYKDWSGKWRKAAEEAGQKIPRLSEEDRKDRNKLRAYWIQRREAYRKARPEPPVDKVGDILTPDQLGKVLEANQTVAGWLKWLAEQMPKYDKKLDALLGPAPEGLTPAKQRLYDNLDNYMDGGALLGRLGLTAKQETELQELGKTRSTDAYSSIVAPLDPSLRGAKLSAAHAGAVRDAIRDDGWDLFKEAKREEVEKVLTQEQRDLLAKALLVVRERDKAIWKRYSDYLEDLGKIIPKPTGTPGRGAAVRPARAPRNNP